MKDNILIALAWLVIISGTLLVHSQEFEDEQIRYEMAAAEAGTDKYLILHKEDIMENRVALIKTQLDRYGDNRKLLYDIHELPGGAIVMGIDYIDQFELVMIIDSAKADYDASVIDRDMVDTELSECDMDNIVWNHPYENILLLRPIYKGEIIEHDI
jgi:hypothetical protein